MVCSLIDSHGFLSCHQAVHLWCHPKHSLHACNIHTQQKQVNGALTRSPWAMSFRGWYWPVFE